MSRCPAPCVPHPKPANGAKGREAELAAHRYLLHHGYQPIARNVRTKYGEIDIIAKDGETLVFIEVKSRSGSHALASACEAVGVRKQGRVRMLATWFLREHGYDPETPCRFDVVVVDLGSRGLPAARLLRDAF